MTVAKLTEELNPIEVEIMVLENIDSDEQRVAMTRKSLENSLRCYKELLREKRKKMSVQTSSQDFFHMIKDSNGATRIQ